MNGLNEPSLHASRPRQAGSKASSGRAEYGRLSDSAVFTGAFVLALAILLAVAVISYRSIARSAEEARLVAHTHQVLSQIEEVLSVLKDAETGQRGYIIAGEDRFLAPYHEAIGQAADELVNLRRLIRDNGRQAARVDELEALVASRLALIDSGIEARKQGIEHGIAHVRRGEGKAKMDEVRKLVAAMKAEELELLGRRESDALRSADAAMGVIVAGNFTSLAIIIAAFLLLRRENRKRAEAERSTRRYAGGLEEANKELESFSYSVSHDLRTPLRAIDGYSRMLQEDYEDRLDGEGKRLLGVIRDSSRRMGQLIDDLLTFSRLGRKALATSEIDMRRMAEEVLKEVMPAGGAPAVKLATLPPALGDPALVRQVWANLLSNAVKFSGKHGQPQIEVSGRGEGVHNVYCVKDNGAGFDMRYYGKLFGVFQRLHPVDEYPGTGVGLAIVQRVVTRHGGRAWAEGRLGEGAAFYFSLPRGGQNDGRSAQA